MVRDAGNRSESRLGRWEANLALRPLGVSGSISMGNAGPPDGKPLEPHDRVLNVFRRDHVNCEVEQSEPDASYRRVPNWPIPNVAPFHKEIWEFRGTPEQADLRPKPPDHQRRVEVKDGLPFHDRALSELVVANRAADYRNHQAVVGEEARDAARPLVNVGDDLQSLPRSMIRTLRTARNICVSTSSPSAFALAKAQ